MCTEGDQGTFAIWLYLLCSHHHALQPVSRNLTIKNDSYQQKYSKHNYYNHY